LVHEFEVGQEDVEARVAVEFFKGSFTRDLVPAVGEV
jgi:hypothetical protein